MTLTLQTINVGGQANDGSGDSPRAAGQKINANFGEVAAAIDTQNAGIEQKFAQQDHAIGAFLDAAGDQVDEMLEDLATGQFPAGTLAGPSIAFSVDPDTGFYRPAADTVAAVVGGAEALRWNATGLTVQGHVSLGAISAAPSIGMHRSAITEIAWTLSSTARMRLNGQGLFLGLGGTSGAAQFLAIDGGSAANGGAYIRFNKNGATSGYFGHDSAINGSGTSNDILAYCSAAFKIYTLNALRLTVDTQGNVGIGRAADVVANYRVLDMDGPSGGYIGLRQAGTTHGVIYANSGQMILQANGAIPIALFTNGAERLTVTGAGLVGIGTNNPARALEVQTVGGAPAARFASPGGTSRVEMSANAASQVDIAMGATANIAAAAPGMVRYDNPTGYMAFLTAATERMRIDAAGRVGIGITALAGYNLRIGSLLTGSTQGASVYSAPVVQADVTGNAQGFVSAPILAAGVATNGVLHFRAEGSTLGAGAAIQYQYGFSVSSGMANATISNRGFYSDLAASGTLNWNLFMAGDAPNFLQGGLSVGTNANAGTGNIRATGTIRPGSFTVATLPSASAAGSGAQAYVTDASATTYRAIVAGGGSNRITVVSDATNWLIGA